jgi:alginate O-acetyltransferase complex protein AlgI
MLFNSSEFIFIFLPVTFFIYFYLNKKRLTIASRGWLVFTSLFFYSWWNVIYLPLILGSMLFNYILGSTLTNDRKNKNNRFSNKSLLLFGILMNLLLLAYFKYADFFIENFNLALNTNISLFHLALPLAISFFTFQQIAYLVDSYKKETKEYDFLNYSVFVSFFPQLIAGPIVHHKEMMPQFAIAKNMIVNYHNIIVGLFIFSIGLFKKVVIADTFAKWANIGFDQTTVLNFFEAWATSLSYTFQLYFDFSGYCDMAIGLALLFNIKLPINFNSPYKAKNIQDFWRRWHITLSRFLRDYIYIPLGGNKLGNFRTYNNLMTTFIIGGFWHGAGWTFLFWGFLHGLALSIHRIFNNLGFKLWGWVGWLITFNFVNIAWVFFRAKEWEDAIKVLKGMISIDKIVLPDFLSTYLSFLIDYNISFDGALENMQADNEIVVWILVFLFVVVFFKNSIEIIKYPELLKKEEINVFKVVFYSLVLLLSLVVMSLQTYTEFIYFNF